MAVCSGPYSQADLRLILSLGQCRLLGLAFRSAALPSFLLDKLPGSTPTPETNPRPSALCLMGSTPQTSNYHPNPRSHARSLQVLPVALSGCLLVQS